MPVVMQRERTERHEGSTATGAVLEQGEEKISDVPMPQFPEGLVW